MTEPTYPYADGDVTVLGPEIFASPDGDVISWKGDNYVRQAAVSAGVAPAPDQAALLALGADAIRAAACPGNCGAEEECARTRIQPLVWHHGVLAAVEGTPEQFAAAVLAVLPPPADRAAVLNEAADFFRGLHATGTTITVQEAEQELRRMAAESTPADTEHDVRPTAIAWDFEGEYEADRWHGIGHTYRNGEHDQALAYLKRRAETDKEHRRIRMVRAATTYTVEAECIPAAAQQPKEA